MNQAGPAELEDCDAVFRGGITSGVIYPGAVATLAKRYRLRSIGGGSAGAIAAGIAAAAEYGRSTGRVPRAFDKLEQIAVDVSGGKGSHTNLKKLFSPTPSLVWLNGLARTGLERGAWRAVLRLVTPALAMTAAGLALGLALLDAAGWAVALAFALLIVGVLVQLARLKRALFETLPQEGFFGLCPGVNRALGDLQDPKTLREQGALMDWMHATIQDMAGRSTGGVPTPGEESSEVVPEDQRPLTMRDLWGEGGAAKPRINLSLSATNLTQQLPHQFPFLERDQGALYFVAEELEKVLPRDVVRWMVIAARAVPERVAKLEGPRGLRRLPAPEDLPLLLGVRLSLSFPGLLAAVPLWAEDRPDHAPSRLVRCWFSDGGITSNFPINSFDSALPTRPTFGFNLRDATPQQMAAAAPTTPKPGRSPDPLVVAADSNTGGMPPRAVSDIGSNLPAFLVAIVDTARNARENELMLMPGYRDRIVHIAQRPGEGGLSLGMDSATILKLSARGATAAQLLVDRFHPRGPAARLVDFPMDWDNHRWVRYRTLMAAVERLLSEIRRGADDLPENLSSYRWPTEAAAERAAKAHSALLELAEAFEKAAHEQASATGDAPSLFDRLTPDGARSPHGGNSPRPKMGLALHPIGRDPARSLPYP